MTSTDDGPPVLLQLRPPGEAEELGGVEALRCFLVDDGLSVVINPGAFDDLVEWAILLADVAHHVARMAEAEGIAPQETALAEMKRVLDDEWNRPSDVGVTQERRE